MTLIRRNHLNTNNCGLGGSSGLVVMGWDSCSKGQGFKSQHCVLDGHFFTYICWNFFNDVCLKRPKINDKWSRGWPFFKKRTMSMPLGLEWGYIKKCGRSFKHSTIVMYDSRVALFRKLLILLLYCVIYSLRQNLYKIGDISCLYSLSNSWLYDRFSMIQ